LPIDRRTTRTDRGEPAHGVPPSSPVIITRPDGTTVTEPLQLAGTSVRTLEQPEPPGGHGRLDWEQKADPVARVGFMVARCGAYHARIDAKGDGWRWVVWTNKGRVARGVASTWGLAARPVEDVIPAG